MGKENQPKEYNRQIKKALERLERRKFTRTWEYWKWTPNIDERKTKKIEYLRKKKFFRNQTLQEKF